MTFLGLLLLGVAPRVAAADDELVLIRRGKPAATIVVPDKPLAACNSEMGTVAGTQVTAAEELQKYLEKVSGTRLPIVPAAQAPATGTLILVGRSALSERYGLSPPRQPEGLRIESFPRGIALLGEIAASTNLANNTAADLDRGIMHAVYVFLERYVDCRFYFTLPGDEELGVVIPKRKTIAIALPVAYTDAPAFTLRQNQGLGLLGASRGGSSDRFRANHTHVGWRDRYQISHPEFFALNADGSRNWKYLCYSEPGVLQAELRQLEEYYRAGAMNDMASQRYIPVLPDDVWQVCQCDRCKAKGQGGPFWGRQSDLWFDYVRRLATEVRQRWPDKRVVTLAYRNHTQPPTFDLPDNVDVMVCMHPYGPGVPIAQLYMAKQPEIYRADLDLMRRWSDKLGKDPTRLSLWDYFLCSDAHTGMPVLFPHTLQTWLRDMRPISRGVFIDGQGQSPREHLMLWLWMRLLWNPELDIEAAVADHCRQFYGPAGEPMTELYRLLIDRYEQTVFPERQFREENCVYLSHSIGMVYGRIYPPEVIDRIEERLHAASRRLKLPTDPDWEVRDNTAWTLRNEDEAPRTYPVRFSVVDGRIARPTLRWARGELTYAGEMLPGDRLLVTSGPRATLEHEGKRQDVTAKLQGDLPTIPAGGSLVVQYDSRQSSKRDRMHVAMGKPALKKPIAMESIYQRRLMWMRRFFEVHELGEYGVYTSPQGPLVLARMTQQWLGKVPEYDVVRSRNPPPPDLAAKDWQQAKTIPLIQGSPRPMNADANVGFLADLPTDVRLLQDPTNLYVAFHCAQWLAPNADRDQVTVSLYRGAARPVFSVTVRADGTLTGDTARVQARTSSHFPSMRTVKLAPGQVVSVETGPGAGLRTRAAGNVLLARTWSGIQTRTADYESYLRFELPELEADESILRATFHGYAEQQLQTVYVTGVNVSYSPDDTWDAQAETLTRRLPLEEPDTVLNAGNDGGNAAVWFESDITRHLQRPNEGAGRPLTLGITANGGAGLRGLAVAGPNRGDLAPYLQLEIGRVDLNSAPWWDAFITIPKAALGAEGAGHELRADLTRRHGERYYQWAPPLAYLWEFRFPPQRRGHLIMEEPHRSPTPAKGEESACDFRRGRSAS